MKRLIVIIVSLSCLSGHAQTNGLRFDGSSSSSIADRVATPYIGIPDSSARTVEMWIKRGSTSTAQGIFSEWGLPSGDGARFTFKVQNNHLRVESGGSGNAAEGTTFLSSNTWYHVAAVIDPTLTTDRLKIYLNGNLELSSSLYLDTDTNVTAPLHIGTRFNGVGGFNGAIDEFRVWNVARTQAEIQANMNTELCTLPTELVSYFKFNEGIAGGNNTALTTVLDEVNPSNTNTLTNFSLTGTLSNFVTGTLNATTDLTIVPVTSCSDYTWAENGTTYSVSGVYDVLYTNSNGCDSIVRLDLTIPILDNTVTDNMDGTLTANMAGVTYQWLDCDNGNTPVSGATAQIFIASGTGNFSVEISNAGCVDTSSCFAVTSVPGYINPAMDFDGTDDYILTQHPGIAGNGARTVEAWIKIPTDNTTTQHVIADWGTLGTGTRFTTNILAHKLRLEVQGSGVNANSTLNDNLWHHVAVSYDPTDDDTIRLYVDGIQEIATKLPTTINTGATSDIHIGGRIDDVNFFYGSLDEVRIWNTARTAGEINALMNTSMCNSDPNLISYFSFNEGVPLADNTGVTNLKDYAAYTQDATPNGLVMNGTNSNFVVGPDLPSGMDIQLTEVSNCESYTWAENSQTYTSSGNYSVTTTGVNGCDSTNILQLTILQPATGVDTQVSCGSYTWINGTTYSASNTTATHTIIGGAVNGCDSIVTLNLTIPVIDNTVTDNMNGTLTANSTAATYQWLDCDNGNAILPGETSQNYTALTAGTYSVELTQDGCTDTSDCIVVSTTPSFINPALHFDGSGDYIQTASSGVSGNNAITVESWVKTESLNNEQIITTWGSDTYNGGRFTFRLNAIGSDDVLRIEIKNGGINGTINVNDGNWHHVAVTYDPLAVSNKYKLYVDGVLDVEGDITQPLNVGTTTDVIIGRRIVSSFGGFFSGIMDEVRIWNVARTAAEINAMMNTSLCTANPNLVSYFSFNEGIPQGDNTLLMNLKDYAAYTQNAQPMDLLMNGTTSNFVVGPFLPSGIDFQLTEATDCESYTWSENSQTYTSSGLYTFPQTGTNGCDSVLVLNLVVNQPTNSEETQAACESYTWAVNNQTYTSTGDYTVVIPNSNNCDSTITLHLTINQPTTGSETVTACEMFNWSADGNDYTSSGTYTTTISNAVGCDSVVTLFLTVNQPTTSTIIESACTNYTWTQNGETYTTSGLYTDTVTNVAGCDSIITLDLSITTLPVVVTNNGDGTLSTNLGGVIYQWYNCDSNEEVTGETESVFTPVANGNYAVIVTDGTCEDTSECVFIGNVGISELEAGQIHVYPNPFEQQITLAFNGPKNGTVSVKNIQGQVVYRVEIQAMDQLELDLGNQSRGVYFIEYTSPDYTETFKVSKQ